MDWMVIGIFLCYFGSLVAIELYKTYKMAKKVLMRQQLF